MVPAILGLPLPNADPVGPFTNLVRPFWLPMRHPDESVRGGRTDLLFEQVVIFIIRELLPRMPEMADVHLGRQAEWWSFGRRRLRRWEFDANQAAGWVVREQLRVPQ